MITVSSNHDDGIYHCILDGSHFSVYFNLSGMIVMTGDLGLQWFSNTSDCPPERLHRYLKDEASIYKAAQHHKEGVTNKVKFMREIHRLVDDKKYDLTEQDRRILYHFIQTTDLHPEPTKRQLIARGYERIIDGIQFEDPNPELISTCNAMSKFIEYLKTAKISP